MWKKHIPKALVWILTLSVILTLWARYGIYENSVSGKTAPCAFMTGEDMTYCQMYQAVEKKDVRLCDAIPSNIGDDGNKRDCYSLVANVTRDYALCSQIDDWEASFFTDEAHCLTEIATLRSDCDSVSIEAGLRENCYRIKAKNILSYAEENKCSKMRNTPGWETLADICEGYRQWRMSPGQLCQDIKTPAWKRACLAWSSDEMTLSEDQTF